MAEAKKASSTARATRGASIAKVSEASSRAPEAPPPMAVLPDRPFHAGTVGCLESALEEVQHVIELLGALAACDLDINARCLYPAADSLKRAHTDATAALDRMFAARAAEVSA